MKGLGLGIHTATPVGLVGQLVREAEKRGFDSVWISEDPYFADAVPYVTAAALASSRLKVATGIINPYTRHPVYAAMLAGTLAELTGGRFILGLGRGVRSLIEGVLGIPYGSPTRYLQEYVELVRALLQGEEASLKGQELQVGAGRLRFQVGHRVPIYLAGMGPKMLRLAGAVGDGVIFNSCSSPAYLKRALRWVEEGVRASGREMTEFRVASAVWLSLAEDEEKAYTYSRRMVAFFLSIPRFGELILSSNGYSTDILPPIRQAFRWGEVDGDPFWHLEQGNPDEAASYVPDELVDRLTITGSRERCLARLDEFYRAGVETLILFSITEDPAAPLKLTR